MISSPEVEAGFRCVDRRLFVPKVRIKTSDAFPRLGRDFDGNR